MNPGLVVIDLMLILATGLGFLAYRNGGYDNDTFMSRVGEVVMGLAGLAAIILTLYLWGAS